MTPEAERALWRDLTASGLVESDAPFPSNESVVWIVGLIQLLGGWMAALFLGGFLGTIFALTRAHFVAAIVAGLTCASISALLVRMARRLTFLDQFALAIGLAGQGWLLFGLFELFDTNIASVAGAFFVVQGVLIALNPAYPHRLVCGVLMAGSLALWLGSWPSVQGIATVIIWVVAVMLWLLELCQAPKSAAFRAMAYGFSLVGIGLLFGSHRAELYAFSEGYLFAPAGILARTSMLAALVVLSWLHYRMWYASVLNRSASNPGFGIVAVLVAVIALSFSAPGFGALLLLTVIAFAHSQSVLLWISGIALLGYLADYYYALDQTLLVKSVALVLMGVALLLARVLHRRRSGEAEAVA